MRYGSVCSGIEAASVAWSPLGWHPEFFSEIEPFPCSVLAHHYGSNLPGKPLGNGVPNHGDMTKFKDWPDHAIDLLVGGTPCQSFSIAGLRAGLADPRGNLMLTYLAIAARYRPRWLVWENVPGVLSSGKGRDFGSLLGGLGELGYGFAYRVLDAQFCRTHGFAGAVPQRRRRVFVVGYLGDWRRAAAVLFDGASLRGDPAPRREAGQNVAVDVVPSLTASGRGVERTGETRGQDPVIAGEREWPAQVAPTLNAAFGDKQGLEDQHALNGAGLFIPAVTNALTNNNGQRNEVSDMVNGSQPHAVAFQERGGRSDGVRLELQEEVAYALTAPSGGGRSQERNVLTPAWAVRRLTPTECARLQAFPDDYLSQVKHRGKPAADGPMYKAFGNSMAVNVMRIIGERIALIDAIP